MGICRAIPALLRLSRHCRPPQVHVQVDPPSSESRARPGDRRQLLYPSPSAHASSSSEGSSPAPLSFSSSATALPHLAEVTRKLRKKKPFKKKKKKKKKTFSKKKKKKKKKK